MSQFRSDNAVLRARDALLQELERVSAIAAIPPCMVLRMPSSLSMPRLFTASDGRMLQASRFCSTKCSCPARRTKFWNKDRILKSCLFDCVPSAGPGMSLKMAPRQRHRDEAMTCSLTRGKGHAQRRGSCKVRQMAARMHFVHPRHGATCPYIGPHRGVDSLGKHTGSRGPFTKETINLRRQQWFRGCGRETRKVSLWL